MIVIADADIIRNEVSKGWIGRDACSSWVLISIQVKLFGNRDFLINCINYLVDDNGIMELRSRELKLRLLNKAHVKSGKFKWQIINVACPLIIVILAGLLFSYFRKENI